MIEMLLVLNTLVACPPTSQEAAVLPAERWLFAHPSWLRWWVLPNLEKSGLRPITGVVCVFVEAKETGPQYYAEVRERCDRLKLQFAYGIRHSHQSLAAWKQPLHARWHAKVMQRLKATGEPNLFIDAEPYYHDGRRYHGVDDAAAIAAATVAWRELGTRNLFVYPPDFTHPRSIARQARRGGAVVFAFDHWTYRADKYPDLARFMQTRAALAEQDGLTYVPGFYLRYLKDRKTMRIAADYGRCWFFPRMGAGYPDQLHHFGTEKWKPKP